MRSVMRSAKATTTNYEDADLLRIQVSGHAVLLGGPARSAGTGSVPDWRAGGCTGPPPRRVRSRNARGCPS